MKKLVLISMLIAILTVGCSKKDSGNCDDCGASLNVITNACEYCNVTEKEDEKEDEEWISVESAKEIEVLKNKIDYLKGYIAGYKQGYYEAQIDTIGSDLLVNTEYEKGYAEGFEAGWEQCAKDGNDFESKGI